MPERACVSCLIIYPPVLADLPRSLSTSSSCFYQPVFVLSLSLSFFLILPPSQQLLSSLTACSSICSLLSISISGEIKRDNPFNFFLHAFLILFLIHLY